jgi:hypothetical protein
MDENEEKALKDIEQYGCHILHVLEEGDYPSFTYSIGIEQSTDQPELIVTGLNRDLAMWMINEYNRRIREGERFEPFLSYSGFLDEFEVTFREVEKQHYPEYFGWGSWLYKGDDFRVLQLIYPSTSGVWPWDEGAPDEFTWFIPKLYGDQAAASA